MASAPGSFPHPVLGNQDDVGSYFAISEPDMTPGVDEIEIGFRLSNDDPDLKQLLQSGSASLKARWSCSATLGSGYLHLDEVKQHVNGKTFIGMLDQREVRGDVRIEIFVVASQPLEGFSWRNQHEDYGDATFSIEKGDLLADGQFFDIRVGKLYDPLEPPLNSCFNFIRRQGGGRTLEINFNDPERVNVFIPTHIFDYVSKFSGYSEHQRLLVVLPALMETINFIRRNKSDDIASFGWYDSVSKKMAEHKGVEFSFELAQKILENPYFSAAKNPVFNEDDEDD